MKKKFTKMAAALITALCMTACGTAKSDAPGIQTSVVQTTPPAAQTSMPATQTVASSVQTEASSAQTEASSVQTQAPTAAEYEDSVLHEDAFTVSETSYSILLEFESRNKTIYDLRDSRNYGIAVSTNGFETIDFEGIFGIRISAIGSTITYSIYRHSSSIPENASIVLYRVNANENILVKNLGSVKTDTDTNLSVELTDGLYMLTAIFTVGETKEVPVSGYLYVENGDVITCRLANLSQYNLDRFIDAWNNLLQDADPNDFLSNDKITYPTSGTNDACNHVKDWEAISDELVLNDNWTDEAKVFAFVDYLSKNVAYDNYRYRQPGHRSRANIAGDYTDDANFTLGNNVGVCWDYTNILAIMCRHHGIPCTSVDNKTHAFNAVWLNGGWVGIDLTETRHYVCNTKDTDKDNWISMSYSYYHYGSYNISTIMDSYDQNIWTKERGLGLQ